MTSRATKIKLTTTVVIVESPAKCKKIEEYLGPGYKVIASFGHLRELGSLKNIDITNNFNPTYQIVNDDRKQKHIEFMRKDIGTADDVILATDDDREGEAIAWHICMLFDLPINTTKRIIFHEITEQAIQNAMLSPRIIDMNIVYSQQARQILDLLVGFTISPILWKYISKNSEHSLSAGRCQTPALKLVYENQEEINNSPGIKVYNTVGYFTSQNLPFELNKQYDNEDKLLDFLEETVNFEHMYSCSDPRKVIKTPPEPLTTSRIQQMASNELHISPKETMKICQKLYEEGLITYMRTDSKKYSKDFIESTKTFIMKEYLDEKYIHPNINKLINTKDEIVEQSDELHDESCVKGTIELVKTTNKKTTKKSNKKTDKNPSKKIDKDEKDEKDKNLCQEAHEAIRPTNINLKNTDDFIDKNLEPREKKLYKLIWETSIESCMCSAEYLSITASFTAPFKSKYQYSSEIMEFPGWKIVKTKSNERNKDYSFLQTIKHQTSYNYKKITSLMTLKDTKQHYTEARLVQLLEDNGIGRPSTFSTLVDKIQERGYVKKENIEGVKIECVDFELEDDTITEKKIIKEFGNENNKLIIQPLGTIVMNFLDKHFNSLFNYEYTKTMENDLDKILKGEKEWIMLCKMCFDEMELQLKKLKEDENEKKHEIKIDENHSYIIGKFGPVIKCIDGKTQEEKDNIIFKTIKKDIDLTKLEKGEYKLEDLLESENEKESKKNGILIGKFHSEDLFIKKGKYGIYAHWGENNKSLSCFGNRPIENILYDDVLKILMKDEVFKDDKDSKNKSLKYKANVIREITNNVSIRNGSYGDYIFFKTSKMKKPVFYKLNGFKGDYKTCNIDLLKSWIIDQHKIRI